PGADHVHRPGRVPPDHYPGSARGVGAGRRRHHRRAGLLRSDRLPGAVGGDSRPPDQLLEPDRRRLRRLPAESPALKALVTGGAGFIGSHIADRLLADGHEVVILDDLSTGHVEHLASRARFYQMDVHSPWLEELFRIEQPQAVLHQAAQASVRRSVDDPVFDAGVNVLGTVGLLQASVRHGVRRFLFASTGGALYGDAQVTPTPEDYPTLPVSPYGASKLAAEVYLRTFHAVHGLSYAALRYANVYGPRQDPHGEAGVVAIFSRRLLSGETTRINGDGKQTRDFVYVGDVADANVRALASDAIGSFNVGTGIETD